MRFAALLLLAGLTAGCMTAEVGNFSDLSRKDYYAHMRTMSADTVNKLVSVFPPAKTHLQIMIDENREKNPGEFFGDLLVGGLRENGYATLEGAVEHEKDYYPVSYLIRNGRDETAYHLILNVGDYALTRLYRVDDKGDLVPASAWTMRQ